MINFDNRLDRKHTCSVKWSSDTCTAIFGNEVLPFWIADMDFEIDEKITKALVERTKHANYGYTTSNSHKLACIDWQKRRHNWDIELEQIVNTPGVVCALSTAVQTLCEKGDQVIIQSPVYPPFRQVVVNNGCKVADNHLLLKNNRYEIDFEDFEAKAKQDATKLFILCSPHNPIGRVWTKEELCRLMDICLKHHVFVVADEIHHDLIFKGEKHHVLANLDERYKDSIITCTSPSKTFNLAAFHVSNIIIPNADVRKRFVKVLEKNVVGTPTPFGIIAATVSYNECEQWLDEVLDYIEENSRFVREYLAQQLPQVTATHQTATFLTWLDFRAYQLTQKELEDKLFHEAKVGLNTGTAFGIDGKGFMRLNLGCPRQVLQEGLDRIIAVFSSL